MITFEQTRDIINGIHLAVRENKPELLNEVVGRIEDGLINPLFRAFIGYGNLPYHHVYNCMKLSAEFLNNYYGKAPIEDSNNEDEFWESVMTEADNMLKVVLNTDEGNSFLGFYFRNIIVEMLNVLEQEYVSRKNKNGK